MKVLLIDYYGTDGMLDFALRCWEAGHKVRWSFKKNGRNDWVGKGLLPKECIVENWREWMRWADVVVLADNTHYLREIDAWRRNEGVPVVGATSEAAQWELERETGQKIFKKAGIQVPAYRKFSDYDSAIAYVKKEGRAFVSKPCYDEVDKSLSYVGKTPADLVFMLERWKKTSKLKGSFILQEKVSGCEMAVGAWFGAHGFSEGWCENFEFKSLMAGDKGPNVGEMGTVVRYVRKSKLADKVLKPLEGELRRLGYCGYVDVNCIIDEQGTPWPLEFTMRMGWPTFNIQQALNKGDPVEWLASLSQGQDAKPWRYGTISVGVVMAMPQFPYETTKVENMVGVPLSGLTPSMMPHIHPCGILVGEAPQDLKGKVVRMPCWQTANDYVLVASGTGETVRRARAGAYRLLDQIKLPNSPFWRPDIGQRLKDQLPAIQAKGYATNMTF